MHGSVFLDARRRGDPPGAAVERPADGRRVRRDHRARRRGAAARAGRQPGADRLPGAQDPVAARPRAGGATRACASVLLPKDYVRLRLTGERATDASDAVGHAAARRPRARLVGRDPRRARDPARVAARASTRGPRSTGTLRDERRRRAGPAARAAGRRRRRRQRGGGGRRRRGAARGSVSSSIGTSGVLFAHRDEFAPDPSGRVHAFCHAVPGRVPPDGGDAVGRRLAELVARARSAARLRRRWSPRRQAVPPGAEGLLFLPYLTRRAHAAPGPAGARRVRRASRSRHGARRT